MEHIRKRKFSEFIANEELVGAGEKFTLLSKEILDKGLSKTIPVSAIELNKYRPVSREGLDRIDASMKFHHSEKLNGGQVQSATTRIFACQASTKGKYIVLDGNHRVEYWRSKGWEKIPAIIINKQFTEKEIEIFAENQNLLQEAFSKQRNGLQILNRTVKLLGKNPEKTIAQQIEENKPLFLKVDVGRKYFTLAKLMIEKKLEWFLLQMETEDFPCDFTISKVLSHNSKDLSRLNIEDLKEILKFSNNPKSTISLFFLSFVNFLFIFCKKKQKSSFHKS